MAAKISAFQQGSVWIVKGPVLSWLKDMSSDWTIRLKLECLIDNGEINYMNKHK